MFFRGRNTEIFRCKPFLTTGSPLLRFLVSAAIALSGPCLSDVWAQGRTERIEALVSALEKNPGISLVDSINNLGYSTFTGNLVASTSALSSAYKFARIIGYSEGEALAAENLGLTFYLSGAYDSSTFYNLRAISLYRQLGNEVRAAKVLCGHGYQMKRRNLKEAFSYYRNGLSTLQKIAPREEMSSVYNNYGVLHEMNNDLDSAIHFYSVSLALCREFADSLGIPFSLNTLAFANLLKGDTVTARPLLQESLEIRRQRNDVFGVQESTSFFGDYFAEAGDCETAIRWYRKSIQLADSLGIPYAVQYNHEKLTGCLEKTGRLSEAILSLRTAQNIKDSLLNTRNAETIIQLEKRFELSQKELDNFVLRESNAKKTFWIYVAFSSLMLFASGGALFFQVYRRRRNDREFHAILKEREAGLRAVFEAAEEERKRLARELHDGIGQQLSGLKLAWSKLSSELPAGSPEEKETLESLSQVLDETCTDVRELSHRMMPRALVEVGLPNAIADMLSKSLGTAGISNQFEHFNLPERLEKNIEIGLYRVCQELVANIIKHSGASETEIQLYGGSGMIVLMVEDNGRGIPEGEVFKGIGLLNIQTRINALNGELRIEPGPEKGTVVTIKIPVHRNV